LFGLQIAYITISQGGNMEIQNSIMDYAVKTGVYTPAEKPEVKQTAKPAAEVEVRQQNEAAVLKHPVDLSFLRDELLGSIEEANALWVSLKSEIFAQPEKFTEAQSAPRVEGVRSLD
jgi:hypothetical protein